MFFQNPHKRPGLELPGTTGSAAANYFDRLPLVKLSLGESRTRRQNRGNDPGARAER
jgi:hypothetical protein